MSDPYLVVSTDNHAGPSLERDLRPYCQATYLGDFDDYVEKVRSHKQSVANQAAQQFPGMAGGEQRGVPPVAAAAYARCKATKGQHDPGARRKDMDAEGIAAEVIFAGGQNDEQLPFVGFGVDGGPTTMSVELLGVGCHIWNLWLSDFVSDAPQRHLGVMQVPIYDVEASIREVEWGRHHGLTAVNLPAPRPDFADYTDPRYEPFWAACESLGVLLGCHSGGGETPLGTAGTAGHALFLTEMHWLGRRGLWQLIFGGVFERHPDLKLFFAEQRADWVPYDLSHMDSVYKAPIRSDIQTTLPRSPSEYWYSNCFNSGSFLSRQEVSMREAVGLRNLMWASDYPHAEGTFPNSRLSIRNTFHDIPEPEVRRILGENAVALFGLDMASLKQIARRIGPTVEEVATPVQPTEIPEWTGYGFREIGTFA